MNIKSYMVDAFTTEPFKGNPAAVCLLEADLPEQTMQAIAMEFNLSETAFVRATERQGHYSIRYFSPRMEIPLCGHATLASAKVLFEQKQVQILHFTTVNKLQLIARKANRAIAMEFPLYETTPAVAPPALLDALGLKEIVNCEYNGETRILMIEIEGTKLLANLQPDFNALVQSHTSINGVCVTCASPDEQYDFHSRYFWPWSGSNEDPVTGGTHTFLARYWGKKLNKGRMTAFQSSARTGSMEIELINSSTCKISGDAVIVLEGGLRI
jgi:PhzF family phenazine biosynthesis protein